MFREKPVFVHTQVSYATAILIWLFPKYHPYFLKESASPSLASPNEDTFTDLKDF